ncbi:MAG: tetratricopeptide repeat protein, partial [Planctomycetes bacterium]|nr:tetratricopeptide repeat protein [Planctomycetota bacterium]
ELTSPRDLAFLAFLEAQTDFRADRTREARTRLGALLDQDLPSDLSRGEVAGLIWHAEVREEELERIRTRRAKALDLFASAGSHDDQPLQVLAKICAWQVRMEAEHGAYVLTDAGNQELEEIERALDQPWLDYRLQEKWLELQGYLIALAREHRDSGDFDKALATLHRCRKLVRNLPRYRREEAILLARKAASLPAADEEQIRATWREAGDAYRESASLNFGDAELFLDATEAYLSAGEVGLAKSASALYVPRRAKTAGAEANFWRILLYKVRIERTLGNVSEALRLLGETSEREEAGMHRYELLLEHAACSILQGDEDAALADYDRIYSELQPSNATWREALFQKARLLGARVHKDAAQASAAGVLARGPEDAAHRAAREAWEEIAAWLPADGADQRLADALYFAGEARIDIGDQRQARRHFDRLVAAAVAARDVSLPAAARSRWELARENALFLVADTHFYDGDYETAAAHYKEVVRQFGSSVRAPYGFYQLGECALRRGRKQEAVEYFQRGERRIAELPPQALDELPPRRGKQFWQDAFSEKIAMLSR